MRKMSEPTPPKATYLWAAGIDMPTVGSAVKVKMSSTFARARSLREVFFDAHHDDALAFRAIASISL